MSNGKPAEERKNEILDAAQELFRTKGYENTGVTDIMKKVGIAKGTLYYHFTSKEEILDAMIHRIGAQMIQQATRIAVDKTIPLLERVLKVMLSLNANTQGSGEMLDYIHNPQNALLHQKSNEVIIAGVTPILTKLIEEGIQAGIVHTDFPEESVEMVLIYALEAFDGRRELSQETMIKKTEAFLVNLERIFGAEPGTFDFVRQLF